MLTSLEPSTMGSSTSTVGTNSQVDSYLNSSNFFRNT